MTDKTRWVRWSELSEARNQRIKLPPGYFQKSRPLRLQPPFDRITGVIAIDGELWACAEGQVKVAQVLEEGAKEIRKHLDWQDFGKLSTFLASQFPV